MADIFDIIDIIFHNAVELAGLDGFVLYKKKPAIGEKKNHVTVETTGVMTKDYVNKAPAVNINIFVKLQPNGMIKKGVIEESVRKIKHAINVLIPPPGMYFKYNIEWTEPLGEVKEGFYGMNIRVSVITELD